jgi:putative transposase
LNALPHDSRQLVGGQGISSSGRNTVGLLIRRAGSWSQRHDRPFPGKQSRLLATGTSLIRRNFRRNGPNQLQVTDITDHPAAREGERCTLRIKGMFLTKALPIGMARI